MTLFRICNSLYSDDLSGTGAKLFGGRWNSRGTEMLYLTEYRSLAAFEMLVHNHFKDFSIPLSLMRIYIPENAPIKELRISRLKTDWIKDEGYTRFIGDGFIQSGIELLMKVPSAVIREEHNFLVNTAHRDFKKIKIEGVKNFETDKRLFTI